MTTADMPHPGPRRAFLVWWGHNATRFDWLVLPVMYVLLVGSLYFPTHHPATVVLSSCLAGLSLLSILSDAWPRRHHDRHLCLDCLQAAPVLDPATAVQRHHKLLHHYHHARWWAVYALAAAPLAVLALSPTIRDLPLGLKLLISAAVLACLVPQAYHSKSLLVHRRLAPWCPFCPRPGGDHPVQAPVPDPNGTGTR